MKTAADILADKTGSLVSVSPQTTIFEAMQKMLAKKIGALLIERENRIVGIWTERDFFRNAIEPGFDPKTARIGDYMTTRLISVGPQTPLAKLQDMFLGLFVRHLLVKKGDQYIGLLSMGDVMRALLLEKDKEIKTLNQMASWEYYENWGWQRKYDK